MAGIGNWRSPGRVHPQRAGQSRREVLSSVAALGTVGAIAWPRLAEGSETDHTPLPLMLQMNCEDWATFIGDAFLATGAGNAGAELMLEEVLATPDRGDRPPHVRQASVLLVFSSGQELVDGIYTLKNRHLGSACLFMHATRRGSQARLGRYQVVLN